MKMEVTTKRYLAVFAAVVPAQALFLYASFFANLNSTLAEWSAFGIIWPMQLIHNFMNGRAFQSSLYAGPLGGISLGYVANPYPYISANVIHANFLPYLFAYPWSLYPTLACWYAIIFVWNLVGGIWLTKLIMKRLSPQDHRLKTIFAAAVFLGSGLLSIMDQFAQFTLFAGPVFLAVYYFFLAKRRWAFLAAVAALCLIGEDTAMAAVTFMAYLFLFEPEEGRSYGLAGAAFAIPYLLFVLLIVQPASRAELTLLSATNMSNVIRHFFALTPAMVGRNLKTLWALFTLLPAFLMAGPVFGWPAKARARLIAGLALVSTAPFWAECFARGGGHHLMPPFISTYLAFVVMVAGGRAEGEEWLGRRVPRLALAATAVFLLFSWRVQANLLPNAVKPALYRLSGKADKAAALELSLKVEEASNRDVIAAARALPPEKSLSYLVNNRVLGFIVNRSDIWQCTDVLQGRFAFDETDYYLVQNDALDMACCFRAEAGADYRTVVANTIDGVSDLNCPMTPALRRQIKDALVRPGTHRIVRDDEHVLLLENLHPRRFESHPTTLGFGWTRNLFKRGVIVAPSAAH